MSANPDRAHSGVVRVRAPNPGAMTLSGTNSYVVSSEGWAVVVDPGPADPAHLDALEEAADEIGGLSGILLTHGHADHSEGARTLAEQVGGVPVAAAPGVEGADVALVEGSRFGALEVIETPGHSVDHLSFLYDPTGRIPPRAAVCFCGDLVLGEGSVFVPPDGGSLRAYLESLQRLLERDIAVLAPGHGPYVWEPGPKLREYVEHRLERERLLVAALDQGARETDDLLDAAWSDVPPQLRPAAALTLASHLEKLREEGRLPKDMRD